MRALILQLGEKCGVRGKTTLSPRHPLVYVSMLIGALVEDAQIGKCAGVAMEQMWEVRAGSVPFGSPGGIPLTAPA